MGGDLDGGGAESATDRNLLAPHYGSRQQKCGYIRGRNQQNKGRRPQERQKRVSILLRDVLTERFCVNLATLEHRAAIAFANCA